ncbi:hypothetical protein V7166_13895 [Bacillus thuringiensis]
MTTARLYQFLLYYCLNRYWEVFQTNKEDNDRDLKSVTNMIFHYSYEPIFQNVM